MYQCVVPLPAHPEGDLHAGKHGPKSPAAFEDTDPRGLTNR